MTTHSEHDKIMERIALDTSIKRVRGEDTRRHVRDNGTGDDLNGTLMQRVSAQVSVFKSIARDLRKGLS